ncbi:MAG TPA: hypothetical protein PK177_04830 [Burkholderiaceae bacterium]|nr:hypothetical protein [Burkholderiaceae bacterium]
MPRQEQRQQIEQFSREFAGGRVKDAMRDASAASSDLWKVPVANLHVMPGFNVRLQDEELEHHIQRLADSMLANGFLQQFPLAGIVAVEDGSERIYVADGFSRLSAVKLANTAGAGIAVVPVIVASRSANMADLLVQMGRSSTGKPLKPYELGVVCKRLAGLGLGAPAIAKRLNVTRQYADDLLLLHQAPERIREMVVEGSIAAGTAVRTLRRHGDGALAVLEAAVERARRAGAARAAQRHFASTMQAKAVRKQAPVMYDVLQKILADPGFRHLEGRVQAALRRTLINIAAASDETEQLAHESKAQPDGKAPGGQRLAAA